MMSAEPLWTAEDAAAATGGVARGDWAAHGVSIDSRAIAPGDLFVALRDARDGHDFVADALARGAAAAMVSRVPEGVAPDAPLLVVDAVETALAALGAAARARAAEATVIGVTGSVGKTGSKEMLRAMLAPSGPVHAAEKSFNNHWGVPLTLARMPRGTRWAVIEIGMNHPGEIGPLARLARLDAALITTVAAVHLEAFNSVGEIADAKAEIFEGLAPGGVAVLNADNPHFPRLARAARKAGARIVACSAGAPAGAETAEGGAPEADAPEADARARLSRISLAADATTGAVSIGGTEALFRIGAPGRHLAFNAAMALAAVEALGADLARAALALARWKAPTGRGARWIVTLGDAGIDGEIRLIDESYNANPASVEAALDVLSAQPVEDGVGRIATGRRIAFLGDMLELGPEGPALHAGLANGPAMEGITRVHTAGPLMRGLHDALPHAKRGAHFENSAEMARRAGRLLDAGDVAMVKGSLGSAMRPVVDAILAMGAPRPAGEPEAGADAPGAAGREN